MQQQPHATSKYLIILCLAILLAGIYSSPILAQPEQETGLAPVLSGVIEGKIMEVEKNTLVVETESGKTVRIPMPGKSGKSASEFAQGEFIEAAVSPEGITTSVNSGAHIKHK